MKRANKSPFEYMKFLNENKDPLGLKGKDLPAYTLDEIAQHNQPPSIWTIYEGKVYDITMYRDYHPGGEDILKSTYGKDCTELFKKFHGYINIDNLLKPFQIGTVKK